ncbi:MAG TPA: hypothetical protein VK689_05200, partial [Armatimonadota bacterium]|nr:hypothetical protein [Armatimonadota bacterium]
AGFMPPQQILGGPVRPISVHWARGTFTRAGGKTALNDLNLNTSVGTATGRVVSDDRGIADMSARVDIAKLEAIVDLWPGFKDRLRGGSGEMTVALHGPLRQPRKLAGTVNIIGRNGVLTVEDVDELYAVQPFDEMSARMKLASNGQVVMEEVKMRGPKANVDGRAVVTADGRVQGKGKAWFTRDYTKKLVKPRFLYPLVKLIGYGQLKSDYKLMGTLREARLTMAITRSLIWKVGMKKKVPEHLRKIAKGETPLWSADTVTAAEPPRKRPAPAPRKVAATARR